MRLVTPSLQYKKSFDKAVKESIQKDGSVFWEEQIGSPKDIREYVRIRLCHAKGIALPKGWVPGSTYWLIDDQIFIGEVSIRHKLNSHLRKVGGHIGYWIRPSKRGKGYGKVLLRLALRQAKALGIQKALITCDETHVASRKIIESNGGILDHAQNMGKPLPRKLLYWIKT